MAKVTIKNELCKGCLLCADNCPKKIIELDKSILNKKGYSPVKITDQSKCTACAICCLICPDIAIKVEK